MATYALVQRGVVSIVTSDGASPKNFTLPSPIKLSSAFLTHSIKETRRAAIVQRGQIAAVAADGAGPKDDTITGVDLDRTFVRATILVDRTGTQQSATVKLLDATTVRLEWAGSLAGGDVITAEYEVIEMDPRRGVNIRLTTPTNIEVSWDGGVLVTNETIDVAFEVFDIENLGDDIKEILFRQTRILAFHGENAIEDLIFYDDAGNPITYRIRTFNSKANADAATLEIPDGDPLEVGELTRASVVQDFNIETNDRKSIKMTLTKGPAANPDIN